MSKNHLENFLPSLIIALQDMLLERESRPEKLFLRIKSLDLFSVFLTDNKHIFEGEIIHSCTPKKAFSAIDSKSIGSFLRIDNWHLEYRLKKNSHHLDLNLMVEKAYIIKNEIQKPIPKNLPNIKIKIDLLSDSKLINSNHSFQEALSKLKNQLIKQETEQSAPRDIENIERFIPDMKQSKQPLIDQKSRIRIFDYFGTPFLNEMDLKRGIDNAKNIENKTILLTSQQIKYNQSLRKNHEEMQKIQEDRQLQKNRRSKKISKTRRRKIAIDLNEKTKTKNNKNIFELSTLINLSKIKD